MANDVITDYMIVTVVEVAICTVVSISLEGRIWVGY